MKRTASPAGRVAGSLRGQLMRWLLLPLVALLIFDAMSVYDHASGAADIAYDRTLLASSRAIADRIAVANGKLTVDVPYVALDIFETDTPGRMYYRVTGIDGEFVSGYDDFPPLPQHVPRSETYPALVHFYNDVYRGTPLRIAALYQPVFEGPTRGIALIQVGETLDARQVLTRKFVLDSLWPQGSLVLAVAVLMWVAVRRALRPMQRLAREVGARDSTDLSEFEPGQVHREIRPLVVAMNGYMQRLRTLIEAQRRFIADAAHQLRTPLAVLKTQAEVGLREKGLQALHDVLVAQHATIDRTTHLANQLLSLARIEQGVAARAFERVDLCRVASDVCLELAVNAVHKKVDLALESTSPVVVDGDAMLLRELATNLVDNAIRYTPSGGHVVVRAMNSAGSARLEVQDTGPGIAPAERDRVLEPFYRGAAPGGDGALPGSGLGLTIARDIARSHGATLLMHDVPAGGLRVIVEFGRRDA